MEFPTSSDAVQFLMEILLYSYLICDSCSSIINILSRQTITL